MKVGLLWFDDDAKRDLKEKIARAAKHYRQKYGAQPNVCYIHRSALSDLSARAQAGNDKVAKAGQIRVEVLPSVLLHHLWLGQEDQP